MSFGTIFSSLIQPYTLDRSKRGVSDLYGKSFSAEAFPSHNGRTRKFSNRSSKLGSGFLGRSYSFLYIHPTCYYEDLQASGITNYHGEIKRFLDSFPPGSWVMDLGGGNRRIRDGSINLDIVPCHKVDVVGYGQHLPLKDQSMDGVVIQEVMEHLPDPEKVLEEVWRVLKFGGKIYCEVPFLYPVHHLQDYYRWTLPGLEVLCSRFHKLKSGTCMGPFSVLSVILRRILTHRISSPYLEAGIDLVVGWILSPLKFFDRVLSYSDEACLVGGAFYFVGEKNETADR